MKKTAFFAGLFALLVFLPAIASAEENVVNADSWNKKITYGFGMEYGRRIVLTQSQRPNPDIFLGSFQVVIPFYTPPKNRFIQNISVSPQATFGTLISPRETIVGFELPLRIHFRPSGRNRFFADLGPGINNVGHRDRVEVSGRLQFSLLGRFGIERRLSEKSSRTWELSGGFRHYSDGGTHRRNQDFNAIMIRLAINF
ncbi:MAG: acyloxyacyl hydrolase [Patescibacteria group bacterium]